MMSIHGHEVLQMMNGNDYTESSLLKAIVEKFGADAKFHTCSETDMNAQQLIEFLKQKGKFKPANIQQTAFTVNTDKICRH
ncbi:MULTISPECIES: YecH family metal-binding protein [unclassified Gilliamella]|uniref:YecH family metal-binding protein n=1 Tax=unclassified Gilliamella TaxID=2685620 RepID=UPI001C6A1FE9|nr:MULTISPECIES: YecH family metal-binding protein [unclassified Gilliamella]MCX8600610.1 YecH family protein [Gilliamella sp. B3722]MCX8609150.1 YecH family protein [Gilliamella sp. B3771]MCX8609827.1 YecH family protein [Gilliamella sp. B3891]MCX8612083.1 YecH family protein [Gilliamella sp. B3773]MCX8615587.1 YecH family protein [Gilliamella sp. B3770]MCX8619533.1 YecH family protein [Gilliamella sp. B3892]MCX8621980.1 YecH family protein [Gilliamella sp. B3759]MCX8624410.1 YecH family p